MQDSNTTICLVVFNDYLLDFLRVLIQSFKDSHRVLPKVMLYYFNTDNEVIKEIKKGYPGIILKECPEFSAIAKEKIIRYRIPKKLEIWHKMFLDAPTDKLIFMDIDMLVLKPFDHFLTNDFDFGYCYRTRKTIKNTINAGVFLVNKNRKTKQLFRELLLYSRKIWDSPEKTEKISNAWGGPDQAFFGEMLKGEYKKIHYHKGCALKGFSTETFNHSRTKKISKKCHALHYVGGWRFVFCKQITERRTPERVKKYKTQFKKMRKLWENTLERWKNDNRCCNK